MTKGRAGKVPDAPYRKVINREQALGAEGDEIITLECQHRFRLTHVRRTEFPCKECQRVEQRTEGRIPQP